MLGDSLDDAKSVLGEPDINCASRTRGEAISDRLGF
jgi:hypothetical protein